MRPSIRGFLVVEKTLSVSYEKVLIVINPSMFFNFESNVNAVGIIKCKLGDNQTDKEYEI